MAYTKGPGNRSIEAAPEASFAALEPLLLRSQGRADALIEVLHGAQKLYSYLSDDLLRHVATRLQPPLSRVKGTASFYHLFRFQPPARHRCVVCTGTACQIQGAPALIEAMEEGLGLRMGDRRAGDDAQRCPQQPPTAPTKGDQAWRRRTGISSTSRESCGR